MGLSQSRAEENIAGRPSTNRDSKSIELSSATSGTRSTMSTSNKNSRLRSILPKRRSAAKKTSDVETATKAAHRSSPMPSPSPIVASFMTNISSRCNPSIVATNELAGFNKSYTYPVDEDGGKGRNGGLPLSSSGSGLKWPTSYRKQQARQRMAAALDIPSPVPSLSEPSEDNLSMEEVQLVILTENETRKNQDAFHPSTSTNERQISQSRFSCVSKTTSDTSDFESDTPISNPVITTVQPTRSAASPKSVTWKDMHCGVVKGSETAGLPKKTESQELPNVVRSRSMMEKASETISTEKLVKRPTTLSPYKMSGSRSAWAKLCTGIAPLAESECFVIENSPAVELPPSSGRGGVAKTWQPHPPSPLSSIGSEERDSGFEEKKSSVDETCRSRIAMSNATAASRMQSRLKNPSAYSNRQKVIYYRYSKSDQTDERRTTTEEAIKERTSDSSISDSLVVNCSYAESDEGRPEISSPMVKTKRELHDSGVRMDSFYGSHSDATSGGIGGTAGSPEGSLYRGLIDDEIQDQPELTIVYKSLERVDQGRSRASTIDEGSLDHDTIGECGPVRVHKIRKRPSNRMYESYDSTVSSLSIDSEDMMLDFEGSDVAEEADVLAACDTASTYSSLGRRRKNSGGSWGRRKVKTLSAVGKRLSLEAVMDEWALLKNDLENEILHQRQSTQSDVPPSFSASTVSPGGRVLKPPVSLENVGPASIGLEHQAYRHVVQDVTMMKTMLLRLKRVLQEAETSNPFEHAMNAINGLSKLTLASTDTKKPESNTAQSNSLMEENRTLRNQISLMAQQMEDQNRIIQCLQQQLKQCRRRSLRRSVCALDEALPESIMKTSPSIHQHALGQFGSPTR